MAVKKPVFDTVSTSRSIAVILEDGSTIDLNLSIYLNAEVAENKANSRINSIGMSKVLMLVDHLIILGCKCSEDELKTLVAKIIDS